jgi:hypothetical protein
MGAGQADRLPDVVDEQEPRLHFVAVGLAVDGELDWQFHGLVLQMVRG